MLKMVEARIKTRAKTIFEASIKIETKVKT